MTANNVYWISSALLALIYLTSATLYLVKTDWVRKQLAELGYPGYLVPLFIAVKILAVTVVLWRVSIPLSDLAYAGMFFHLLLAGLAHIGVRKSKEALPAAIGLMLLIISFATQNAAREIPSPYGLVVAAQHVTLN
ncbi:DoxX family protein [Ralstonia solanacearum]|uniref:DoxX family protein n=1 Tax=Ralstonia solanacearum TaxID=305 RepID=UPI0007C95ECB|nr:DoxX family protein [Ralstonia solanacearum]OAI58484.1 membrane protein [Ralstonia solanacearum]